MPVRRPASAWIARYFAEHDQGALYYCTPANGLRVGREGQSYYDVCPPHLAPGFLEPYCYGLEIYQTRSRIDGFERNRRERGQELQKAQSDDERRRLRNELSAIDQNLRRERGVIWRWRRSKKALTGAFLHASRRIIRRNGRALTWQGESHEIPLPRHHHR